MTTRGAVDSHSGWRWRPGLSSVLDRILGNERGQGCATDESYRIDLVALLDELASGRCAVQVEIVGVITGDQARFITRASFGFSRGNVTVGHVQFVAVKAHAQSQATSRGILAFHASVAHEPGETDQRASIKFLGLETDDHGGHGDEPSWRQMRW